MGSGSRCIGSSTMIVINEKNNRIVSKLEYLQTFWMEELLLRVNSSPPKYTLQMGVPRRNSIFLISVGGFGGSSVKINTFFIWKNIPLESCFLTWLKCKGPRLTIQFAIMTLGPQVSYRLRESFNQKPLICSPQICIIPNHLE